MSEFESEFESEAGSETVIEIEAEIEKKKTSQTDHQRSDLIHLIVFLSQAHLLGFLLLKLKHNVNLAH